MIRNDHAYDKLIYNEIWLHVKKTDNEVLHKSYKVKGENKHKGWQPKAPVEQEIDPPENSIIEVEPIDQAEN